ncbi:glycosyl hydrolases family 18 domain-containing protein [Ditylenchus destructor]|nr:glycosyl hydrolases family 18 domain-containing protein [Ditylenchus destructor]
MALDQTTIVAYLTTFVENAKVDGYVFALAEEELNKLITYDTRSSEIWNGIYRKMRSGSEVLRNSSHVLAIPPKWLADTPSFNHTNIASSFTSTILLDLNQINLCNTTGNLPRFDIINGSDLSGQVGSQRYATIAKGKLTSYGYNESRIEVAIESTDCQSSPELEEVPLVTPCEAAAYLNSLAVNAQAPSQRCPPPPRSGCNILCAFDTRMAIINGKLVGRIDFSTIGLKHKWCTHIIIRGGIIEDNPLLLSSTPDFEHSFESAQKWSNTGESNPELLLGYGETSRQQDWDRALSNEKKIQRLAKLLFESILEHSADGIELTFPQFGQLQGAAHAPNLENRLLRLVKAVRILALTSQREVVIVANLNDLVRREIAAELQIYCTLITIPSDRLTTNGRVTHRSQLLPSTTSSQDGRMPTVEELWLNYTTHLGIPSGKLIISLNVHSTAVGFDIVADGWDGTKDIGAHADKTWNWFAPHDKSPQQIFDWFNKNGASLKSLERSHDPYLISPEFLLSFDNLQSLRTKAIWASSHATAGFSISNLQSDAVAGKQELSKLGLNVANNDRSIEKGSFLLLRQLLAYATCPKECHRAKTPEKVCNNLDEYDSFKSVCRYRLLLNQKPPRPHQQLEAVSFPFQKCDRVVLESFARIETDGGPVVLDYGDLDQFIATDSQLKALAANLRGRGLEMAVTINVDLQASEINAIMAEETKIDAMVAEINAFLNRRNEERTKQFSGILINFASVKGSGLFSTPAAKRGFLKLLQKLKSTLPLTKFYNKPCEFTVDIMFGADFSPKANLPLPSDYQAYIRNIFVDVAFLPMFGLNNENSVVKALKTWEESGVEKSTMIISSRSYASTICASQNEFDLDRAQQIRVNKDGSTTYYESPATILIKASYVANNGYRGVSTSLDGDDYKNICRTGQYPLCNVLQDYRCP